MTSSPNRALLVRVATRLGRLLDELVFVGGQVTELLITDPAATRIRPTNDVDAICEVAGRPAYHRLGERLKAVGFVEDLSPDAPTCRWRAGKDVIDVMPTDEEVLRFKGEWYPLTLQTARRYELTDSLIVRIASAPAFLATKWEAFSDRGDGDWHGSRDIEDIVTVVAGRPELMKEVETADPRLRSYIGRSAAHMLEAGIAEDVIAGALPDARVVRGLVAQIVDRFGHLALFGA